MAFTANVVGSSVDRDFSQTGSPRVTLPGFTLINLAGSYAVLQNVWHVRSLRLQLKFENLLDEQYEQASGFSAQGMSVRGGVAVNF